MSRRRIRRRINQESRRKGKTGVTVQPVLEDSLTAQPDHPVLQLQRTIGNKATTDFIQRREDEEQGSATMVSSVAANEMAQDEGSYTRNLTDKQVEAQITNDEVFMKALEKSVGETQFYSNKLSQHPSMAQMGVRPKQIKGLKVGVYIANSNYKGAELQEPKADAERMKSKMEGQNYTSLPIQEDKTAVELDAAFSTGLTMANTIGANALLMYYAGHGQIAGLLGVDHQVEPYSQVMQHLEASVAKGVHTTLVVDACEAGTGTDLLRTRAIERISEKESIQTRAVTEQIARLEDIKQNLSRSVIEGLKDLSVSISGTSVTGNQELSTAPQNTRSIGVSVSTPEREETPVPPKVINEFWQKVIRPELHQVNTYLSEAGLGLEVPEMLRLYTVESIQQQINLFINQLIKLAELIQQEEEESVMEKVGE